MTLVWRTSNMLCENADYGAPNNSIAIEVVRRNAFNRFAEAQKLSLALGRQRATLACKLVHSGAAYLTRDCFVLIQHRKFKGHPVHVVTQNPAPHERHLDHPRICMLEKCVVFGSLSRGRASGSGPYAHYICPGRLGGVLKLKRAYGERYPDHAATDTWGRQVGTVTGVSNAIAKC